VSCFTLENFFRPADRPGCGPLSLGIALRRPPSVPRDRRGRRTARCCTRSREDHPKRDDENWLKHTLAGRDDADRVRLGDRPVRLHPLSNAAFQPSQARLLMRLGVA